MIKHNTSTTNSRNATRPITWKLLCELEPRLPTLYRQARAIRDDKTKPYFCANRVWYGNADESGLRPQMHELVGWARRDLPEGHPLRTSLAYDIAYRQIYNALPDCRNCCCIALWDLVTARMGTEMTSGAERGTQQ